MGLVMSCSNYLIHGPQEGPKPKQLAHTSSFRHALEDSPGEWNNNVSIDLNESDETEVMTPAFCSLEDLPLDNDERSLLLGLTLAEVYIIKTTWNIVKDEPKIGQKIFMRIFQGHSEIKESFRFGEIATDLLYLEPRFIAHGENFRKFIDKLVEKLDSGEESVLDCARPISVIHAKRAKFDPLMFDPEYWLHFMRAVIAEVVEIWEKKRRGQRHMSLPSNMSFKKNNRYSKAQVRSAWHLLLLRIVLEMKISFYKELMRDARMGVNRLRNSRRRSDNNLMSQICDNQSLPDTSLQKLDNLNSPVS